MLQSKSNTLLGTNWFLPALSFVFLALSFYPFRIGWFAIIALTPIYYFAASSHRSFKEVFFGAAGVGAAFSLVLSYLSVVQFHWYADAFLFQKIVNMSFIPIALFSGVLSGSLIIVRRLRTATPLVNVAIGAGTYCAAEMVLTWIFSGYYFGTLAHAVVMVPGALAIASIGGIPLVSYLVAACSMSIAEGFLAKDVQNRYKPVLVIVTAWIALSGAGKYLTPIMNSDVENISVAIIQNNARDSNAFASVDSDGATSFNALAESFERVASNVDAIVYPFSPYVAAIDVDGSGVVYDGGVSARSTSFMDWVQRHVPENVVAVTWSTTVEREEFKNEIIAWGPEEIRGRYAKRHLYPFMDYTPAWARSVGVFSTPVDGVPGIDDSTIQIRGVRVGGLVCSEINSEEAAMESSKNADMLIALGSEAMFVDDVVGGYNLLSARYRAAENGIAVLRGSKFGPSGVFDAMGAVVETIPYGWEGEKIITVPLGRRNTVFAKYGGRTIGFLLVVFTVVLVGREERKRKRGH